MSLLCLASEDDDGNAAAQNAKKDADPDLIDEGNDICESGFQALETWWKSLKNDDRIAIGSDRLTKWKEKARAADKSKNT
jgi:hypothetical protein